MTEYLEPLEVDPQHVAMTDAVPWFFVKSGAGSQSAARDRLAQLSLTKALGIDPGELPARPTTKHLVEIVTGSPRRESLRSEIVAAEPANVVTLGQEGLDAVRGVVDSATGAQTRLLPDDAYGTEGSLTIDGERLRWIPLAHPGLIRQLAMDSRWRTAHDRWKRRARG